MIGTEQSINSRNRAGHNIDSWVTGFYVMFNMTGFEKTWINQNQIDLYLTY